LLPPFDPESLVRTRAFLFRPPRRALRRSANWPPFSSPTTDRLWEPPPHVRLILTTRGGATRRLRRPRGAASSSGEKKQLLGAVRSRRSTNGSRCSTTNPTGGPTPAAPVRARSPPATGRLDRRVVADGTAISFREARQSDRCRSSPRAAAPLWVSHNDYAATLTTVSDPAPSRGRAGCTNLAGRRSPSGSSCRLLHPAVRRHAAGPNNFAR